MKRRGDFHFKKFSIAHDKSTHKVGTDGVLLGAWVDVTNTKRILDIGTGSGLIALMVAQRTADDTVIDAVELQEDDCLQARENILRSPWPRKVSVHHSAIQSYHSTYHYDLIVSNPPYFIDSWLPPDKQRSAARHAHELSFAELLEHSLRLISPLGRLAVVLPYSEGQLFANMAKEHNLFPNRQMIFRARTEKPPERLLVEFSFRSDQTETENLVLYKQGEEWSSDYRALTRDFYLKA